jgi:hypothetical protein
MVLGGSIGNNFKMVFHQEKKYRDGFLTLEILLAMTIMVLILSAVALLLFSGQAMTADSQVNYEALDRARRMLESQRFLAKKDFRLVNSTSTAEDIFQEKIEVASHSFFTKKVKAAVSWSSGNRLQRVELSDLITDYNSTDGGDTCDSNLSGDWSNPIATNTDFYQLAGTSEPISGIDAKADFQGRGRLYVSVNKTVQKTDPAFFIFDIDGSNRTNPVLLGETDNNPNVASAGLAQVSVAASSSGGWAYAASSYGANFNTCENNHGINASCGQLQIIDVNDSANPQIKYTFEIPNVGNNGQGAGRSIFYKNGYVYLGLSKTASGSSHEFNIIDVHDPSAPKLIGYYPVGSGVESIYVKGDYAYLGTDAGGKEMMVLDIKIPQNPTLAGYFNVGAGNGNSLYVVGDNLYLGSQYIIGKPEFNITSVANVSPAASTPKLGFNDIGSGPSNPFSVNGVIVRDFLAFIIAGSVSHGGNLEIFNIANPQLLATSVPVAKVSLLADDGGIGGTAMDCEGNYLYIASADGVGKSYLSIITAK